MMRHYPAIVAKLFGLMLEKAERGGERIAALATSEALWRASEELTGMLD
jgi:hypothetical protein